MHVYENDAHFSVMFCHIAIAIPVADPRGDHGAMAPPIILSRFFNVRFLINFQRYFWIRLLI